MSRRANVIGRWIIVLLPVMGASVLSSGCASSALRHARSDFYRGRFNAASALLDDVEVPKTDEVLLRMERGMILQNQGRYAESSFDFITAADELERLRTYSVSKGTASMVVNDNVQDFTGYPFEQSLLHVFTAKNHFALGNWDSAAVESRRLVKLLKPERLGKYPEDAYTRYITGLGFEMIDDFSNAQLQYKKAAKICSWAAISEDGCLGQFGTTPKEPSGEGFELICLVSAGRVPRRNEYRYSSRYSQPVYAEIYADGKKVGRSYVLADTARLALTSEQIDAARRAAKTVARVAIKDSIADNIEEHNEFLGVLAHIILIELLERPDERRWETLPRWLGVARIELSEKPEKLEAAFKTSGYPTRHVRVTAPLMTRRSKGVTFVRDIVPTDRNVVTGKTGKDDSSK